MNFIPSIILLKKLVNNLAKTLKLIYHLKYSFLDKDFLLKVLDA